MSYLIDTNALSELKKREPHAGVVSWFAERSATSLYLSVLTLGELRKGIEAMTDGKRKVLFATWLDTDLLDYFAGRVLNIDLRIADCWARISVAAGRPLPAIDSLLAATAITHNLTLVTRNVADFNSPLLKVINPWDESAVER